MIKKYKLIKEYPGSPELGHIAEYKNKDVWFHHFTPKLQDEDEMHSIGCHEITLYPEYWQEIVELPVGTKIIDILEETQGYIYEKMKNGRWRSDCIDNYFIDEEDIGKGKRFEIFKEYEILSFKNKSFGTIWIKAENGKFYPEHGVNSYNNKYQIKYNNKFKGTSESWFLGFLDKWEIHSIQRNSDKEIFTVGDNIIEQNEHSKIQYFEILDRFLRIRINHQVTRGSSTILISSNFKKYIPEQPLFITEDGVDIYEGDEFYFIPVVNDNSYGTLTASVNVIAQYAKARFSTKEKAQEYLDSLKPKVLFTTVDGKKIFEGDPFYVYDKKNHKCINAKGGEFKNKTWNDYCYANKNIVLDLIFKNTPCLSLKDIASIYKTANREKPENSKDQGTKLYNLVRKKLNK